jgi:hypothetical protein
MPKMKGKVLGKTTVLKLTQKQVMDARDFGTVKQTDGGYQITFREISSRIKTVNGASEAHVYDKVLDKIKAYANRKEGGGYQDWCCDVLAANGIAWP